MTGETGAVLGRTDDALKLLLDVAFDEQISLFLAVVSSRVGRMELSVL